MFTINTRRLDALEQTLERLSERGIAFAERDTLNDYAFKTSTHAKKIVRDEFINRNTWTRRSIRVDKARFPGDSSEVGSTEKYMREQEFGARTDGPIHVPTPAASGESVRARKRLRVVRRVNWMPNIDLKRRSRRAGGLTRRQQNIAAVRQAADEGRKHVYLDRGRRKGIFRLLGGKRRPRVRLVQDLSRSVRVVPKHPWLAPSVEKTLKTGAQTYGRQLTRQIRRARRVAGL